MQVLPITSTIIDTNDQDVPFIPSYTVAVANFTAGAISLQDSDTDSGFAELKQLPAGSISEVNLRKRYLKIAGAGTVYAFGT